MAGWLRTFRKAVVDQPRRAAAPPDFDRLPALPDVEKVTFFKRDEITTDLICCHIQANGQTWFFHEDAEGWDELIAHLERLPGFRADWYEAVVQPPLAACETVAYTPDDAVTDDP